MPRLYYDEVTIKTYRIIISNKHNYKTIKNYFFEIKGRSYKKTGKKSVLLTKMDITENHEKCIEELRKILNDEYKLKYDVEDHSNKWKWRITWQNFLSIQLHMHM